MEVAKMLSREPIQALFIADRPTTKSISPKKGFLGEVETFGKTAHGSMPDKGRNAVLMMVKIIRSSKSWKSL
jgi:hypothetical protein